MFSDPFWAKSLCTKFRKLHKEGKRAFGPLNSGYWWEWTQKNLPKGSALFVYALASDASQIFKKGHKSFWPLYLIFCNSDAHIKTDRAIQLIGHVPILERGFFRGSDADFSKACLKVWHQAYEASLKCMQNAGINGLTLYDGNDNIYFGYPRLCFLSCDWGDSYLRFYPSSDAMSCLSGAKRKFWS
eukprot:Pompholyxophrys_punicea_v1_NODE_368_length_2146_cov_6.489240.p2 type:complete len:186 gc:universal NODE_368_length_2146_cov_6.489240:986-429(-)